MRKIIAKFARSQSGAVAIIVTLAMTVIIGIVMLTIDLSRQQSQKFNTQGAADSSALAAAQVVSALRIRNSNNNVPPIASIEEKVLENFLANSNLAGDADGMARFDTTFDGNGIRIEYLTSEGRAFPDRVKVTGCFIVEDRFNVFTQTPRSHTVCSSAVANLATFGNAEIVFALDVSASMNKLAIGSAVRRIDLLSDAVNFTIDNLVATYGNGNDVLPETYWGVVPFRGMVDLGPEYAGFVTGDGPTPNAQGAVNELVGISTSAGLMINAANLAKLQRIPLTSRVGESVTDSGSISSTDDFGTPFLSYGSHPYDYWMAWENEANCGYCRTNKVVAPYYPSTYQQNSCTACGCGGGGGGGNDSGGNVPTGLGGGGGVSGGAG